MDGSSQEGEKKKTITEPKTFSVPFALDEINQNIIIANNTPSNPSQEQIIKQAFKYHSQGNIQAAAEYYQYFINQGYKDHRVFSNYGTILKHLGKSKEAEISLRKAIEIEPDLAEAHYNLGNTLKDLGNLKEAELSYRKAIEIKPEFAEAHNNLGTILKDLGRLKEAEVSTRKAIKINPNFVEAHYNLGNILMNSGKLKEASLSLKKTIELNPDFVEAKINLNIVLSKEVPKWHIPMINDNERNNAYLKAIKCAIKENEYVLEIGTGSGLLSMMAIDAGAQKVITCESNKSISEIAKKIIKKNGYQKKITVINKKSTELHIDNDLSQKADLIISEIFSSEFVGEGIQSSILDAEKRLLKEDGKMIPEAGEIKFALLQKNSKIEDFCYTGIVNGYDLSDFNQVTGKKFTDKVNHLNISFLSDVSTAFSFDFYSKDIIKRKEKIIKTKVKKSGICSGLITWIKVNLYGNIYLENNPSCFNNSHWSTPIYTFEKPLEFSKGDIITIKATLLEDKVWFELIK